MRTTASTLARPSRRLALVAAAVVVGLAACGEAETPSASDLPVIAVGASGSGGKVAAGAMESDARMTIMPMDIDYVWAGQEAGATSVTAWRFEGEVTAADATRLAAALGVAGEPVALPAEQGGGWVVGPQDGSAPTVTLSDDGLGSWWFSAPYSGVGAVDCVLPADADPSDSTVPVEVCPEPTPPEGVPTPDEARAATERLLAELGVDNVEVEVYGDEWSAGSTVYPLVDGVRSQLAWSFGFGENGTLQWASGSLLEPVAVGDYPLVGCAAGVARLNDEANAWLGGGVPMPAADLARSTGVAGVPEPAPLPEDQVLIDPAAPVESVPGDTTPVVVTLASCAIERMPVWAADGTVWLLPSYLFTADDGGHYSVIAIDDRFLQPPTQTVATEVPVTEPSTEPPASNVPTTPAPGTEVPNTVIAEPTVEDAQVLVGLPLADAEQLAAESKWTVRALRIDGEDLAGTMDLRPDRVNVEIVDGVVVAILGVG